MGELTKSVLHAGCGPKRRGALHEMFEGWCEVRLDINPLATPDIVASIVSMPAVLADSFDAVQCHHTLEHLAAHEVPLALAEFLRVLKPGGFLFVAVPDLQAVGKRLAEGDAEAVMYRCEAGPVAALDMIYGFRPSIAFGNAWMAHRTGFTGKSLKGCLKVAGFGEVKVQVDAGMNLWGMAWKEK